MGYSSVLFAWPGLAGSLKQFPSGIPRAGAQTFWAVDHGPPGEPGPGPQKPRHLLVFSSGKSLGQDIKETNK